MKFIQISMEQLIQQLFDTLHTQRYHSLIQACVKSQVGEKVKINFRAGG